MQKRKGETVCLTEILRFSAIGGTEALESRVELQEQKPGLP